MCTKLPLGSTASRETGTPAIVSLCHNPSIGCCMCKYCIHVVIELAETHAVPGCAGDLSRTVPVNTTLCPVCAAICGAESVVELSPLPKTYIFPSYPLPATRYPSETSPGLPENSILQTRSPLVMLMAIKPHPLVIG